MVDIPVYKCGAVFVIQLQVPPFPPDSCLASDGIKLLGPSYRTLGPNRGGITRTPTFWSHKKRLRQPAYPPLLMSSSHHPLTEFAFLKLTPPTTLQHPQLISGMLVGIKAHHAWSGYPVHLFIHQSREGEPSASKDSSNTKTTSICVITGWASVEAHKKLMASPESKEIMHSLVDGNLLSFGGLTHLDIDFTKLSFEECSQIIWRKRGVNDILSWEDATGQDIENDDKSGSEEKLKTRRIWSYRGRAVDEGVEDEYELVGFSDGELPEVGEEYKILRKWDIEALSGMA